MFLESEQLFLVVFIAVITLYFIKIKTTGIFFYLFIFLPWQSLSSEVILENSKLPEGMTLAYTSRCKNGAVSEGENGRKCSNISIGDEVSVASSV